MAVEVGVLRRNTEGTWEFLDVPSNIKEFPRTLSFWGVMQARARENWIANLQTVENGVQYYYFHRIKNNDVTGPR